MSFIDVKVVSCLAEVSKSLEDGVDLRFDHINEEDVVCCTMVIGEGVCEECILPVNTLEQFIISRLRKKFPWIKRVVIRTPEASSKPVIN